MTKNTATKTKFNWSNLAFGNQKPINSLNGTFITAPREISNERFKQLIKENLPKGHLVLGLAKERYILGFEGQNQFKTLQINNVKEIINKVNANSPNKIYTIEYGQKDLIYLLKELKFREIIFINGSWHKSFHTQAPYYYLNKKQIAYKLVTPFADEREAIKYANTFKPTAKIEFDNSTTYSSKEMLRLVNKAANQSFDNGFQVGAILAKKHLASYLPILQAHNAVIPYETYAWHHGAIREKELSPINDLNHYDTVHAENMIIIKAAENNIDINNASLFLNVMPCPTCARMICASSISEVFYSLDHSDGYAIKLLKKSGKKVKRIVE